MVGTAFAVGFGLLAVKSGLDSAFYSGQKREALEEKDEAEKQKKVCQTTVKQSQETQQIAKNMVDTANIHESLWEGVSISANQAAQKFNQLQRIDPQGSRRYKFDQKMKAYASDLCDLVKAIDEYLLCLEKLGFLPPNLQLESVLGQTRYCEIDKAVKRAQSQLPAASTAPDSSSPAPAASTATDSSSPAPAASTATDSSSPAPAASTATDSSSSAPAASTAPDSSSPAPAASTATDSSSPAPAASTATDSSSPAPAASTATDSSSLAPAASTATDSSSPAWCLLFSMSLEQHDRKSFDSAVKQRLQNRNDSAQVCAN